VKKTMLVVFLVLLAQANLADPERKPAPPDPAEIERVCGEREGKAHIDCSQFESNDTPPRFKERLFNQGNISIQEQQE